MNTNQAVVINSDGSFYKTELPQENALPQLNELVGGYIDAVRGDDFVGYVNDEGLLIGLPYNLFASILFGRDLVGNVVIVGALNENGVYDGENHDVPSYIYNALLSYRQTLDLYRSVLGESV